MPFSRILKDVYKRQCISFIRKEKNIPEIVTLNQEADRTEETDETQAMLCLLYTSRDGSIRRSGWLVTELHPAEIEGAQGELATPQAIAARESEENGAITLEGKLIDGGEFTLRALGYVTNCSESTSCAAPPYR